MATLLTTGTATVVAASTPDVTLELYDNDGSALTKAAITSLTLTIHDGDGNVINERNATDINDTGIGATVDGVSTVTLTIKPTADDTAFQASQGTTEKHYWKVLWGWTDGDGDARTAGEVYEIVIEKLP